MLDHRWLSAIKCTYEQLEQEDTFVHNWSRDCFFSLDDREARERTSEEILAEEDSKDDDRQKRRKHIASVDVAARDNQRKRNGVQ